MKDHTQEYEFIFNKTNDNGDINILTNSLLPMTSKKKPTRRETQESREQRKKSQDIEWEKEAIRLAKTRRYKNKTDICRSIKRRMDMEGGISFTIEYIQFSIKTSASEFQNIIRNSKSMK